MAEGRAPKAAEIGCGRVLLVGEFAVDGGWGGGGPGSAAARGVSSSRGVESVGTSVVGMTGSVDRSPRIAARIYVGGVSYISQQDSGPIAPTGTALSGGRSARKSGGRPTPETGQ